MNYELAKELKDAGFPQEYALCKPRDNAYLFGGDKEAVFNPLLEELIEACECPRLLLMKSPWKGKTLWQAFDSDDTFSSEQAEGSTPTEAVARLWLVLNKKA